MTQLPPCCVCLPQEQEASESNRIDRETEIATGNPLLNLQAALGQMPSTPRSDAGTSTTGSFAVKRRWDDDLIFKNQAAGVDDKPKKEFVNDILRSEFHRELTVWLFRVAPKSSRLIDSACLGNLQASSCPSSSSRHDAFPLTSSHSPYHTPHTHLAFPLPVVRAMNRPCTGCYHLHPISICRNRKWRSSEGDSTSWSFVMDLGVLGGGNLYKPLCSLQDLASALRNCQQTS